MEVKGKHSENKSNDIFNRKNAIKCNIYIWSKEFEVVNEFTFLGCIFQNAFAFKTHVLHLIKKQQRVCMEYCKQSDHINYQQNDIWICLTK